MNINRCLIITFLCLVHVLCLGANNNKFIAIGEKGALYLYTNVDNQYRSKLIQNAFLHGSSSINDSYYMAHKRIAYVTAPLARIFEIDFNKQTDFVTEIQTRSDNSLYAWVNKTTFSPVWMEYEGTSKIPVLLTMFDGKIKKTASFDDIVFNQGWAFGLTCDGWKETSFFNNFTNISKIDFDSYKTDSWMIAGRSDQVSVYMRKRSRAYATGEFVKDVALFVNTKTKSISGHVFEEMARPFVYSDLVVLRGESAVIQSTDGNPQNTIFSREQSSKWYFYDPIKHMLKYAILKKGIKLLYANKKQAIFSDGSHIYHYRNPFNENSRLELIASVPVSTKIIALCPLGD